MGAQCQAVIDHDAAGVLGDIRAPTLITFGGRDLCTSTRFGGQLAEGIPTAPSWSSILSHAGLHEDPETFNAASWSSCSPQRS